MAPRKRSSAAFSRPRSRASLGPAGEFLNPADRQEKLRLFLQDYESEAARRADIQQGAALALQHIESAFRLQMTCMPQWLRQLNYVQYKEMCDRGLLESSLLMPQVPETLAEKAASKLVARNAKSAKRHGLQSEVSASPALVRKGAVRKTAATRPRFSSSSMKRTNTGARRFLKAEVNGT